MSSNDNTTKFNVNIYHNKYDHEELKRVAKDTDQRVTRILEEYKANHTEKEKREHFFDKNFVLYEFSKYLFKIYIISSFIFVQ